METLSLARSPLFEPLLLPCGLKLKNRIAKSAMSDSLGDGTGHPTAAQMRLYERWADGGSAVSIIGEVQLTSGYAENPGNLVLNEASDLGRFRQLALHGAGNDTSLWLQLGHAGALAYGPTSSPKGPSAFDLPGLRCSEFTSQEIDQLPSGYAATAQLAREAGFGGVQIHAAHGFLLGQFLSPLFNKRTDGYGGEIANRMRLLLEVVDATRDAVGPNFPIAVKLNSTDELEGGFDDEEALEVVAALDRSSIDLVDISGGTYFPGAKSASDRSGGGPYFLDFAKRARAVTTKPLMLTGGFKTRAQAEDAVASGAIDVVGLARALVLEPSLPNLWQDRARSEPIFPRFAESPEGGITAWYTMRLTGLAADSEALEFGDLEQAIKDYHDRDAARTKTWVAHFGRNAAGFSC
ncbi:NADH:flavin oxidoreductase/NADH oxidase family protein [Rhizobium sp. CNPSo 3490]|uniref:NADH:flavin oxidoreductase/NADH oxidase family protein n=1 Tax=Rhizobium sp. CNPSo 3490 TaxID=3021407 RepID=UPI00254EA359|nr:NADH:flavin oxidoreductase/NADH oxidase family protein [Rhizobium sp. CNPSo 3490]MDK4731488.1 NADH:flavin oxidoreductase/NADH oxidase family protein [Rhizobium sp. CNPSo 3490]